MRRLSRGHPDESGAVMIIVAVTLVVMIGFVGLVIDLGRIYEERRELSRAADAAVLAIAADCGTHAQPCTEEVGLVTAQTYADANSDDGASGIDDLTISLDDRTVWTRTQTLDSDTGTSQLPLLFLGVFGHESTTVEAEATAIWGFPAGAGTLPLIVSDCEYFRYVGDDGPDEGLTVTIFFHDGNSTEECNAQAGQDTDGDGVLAGGFGWMVTSGSCIAQVNSENWVSEDPGASPSTGCSPATLQALVMNRTVLVPYFDDTQGLGANGEYHIAGVGAFHITGYNFGGQYKQPSASLAPCSGDERCVSGYFTTAVIDEGDLGGEDRGVVIVRLTG